MDVAVAAYVIDADDIGVGQLSCGLGLMAETDDEVRVLCKTAVQDFYCHNPVQQDIPGLVDVGHAA